MALAIDPNSSSQSSTSCERSRHHARPTKAPRLGLGFDQSDWRLQRRSCPQCLGSAEPKVELTLIGKHPPLRAAGNAVHRQGAVFLPSPDSPLVPSEEGSNLLPRIQTPFGITGRALCHGPPHRKGK